jgi:hypothetical protein
LKLLKKFKFTILLCICVSGNPTITMMLIYFYIYIYIYFPQVFDARIFLLWFYLLASHSFFVVSNGRWNCRKSAWDLFVFCDCSKNKQRWGTSLCSVKHTPKKIMWRSLDFVPLYKVFIYFPRHMMYDVFR